MRSREKVLEIIKHLQDFTVDKGFSPAEAAGAAAKIQELLEKHQLTLLDVESQKLDDDMATETLDTGKRVQNPGESALANAVARGCDCQLVLWTSKTVAYRFLGFASDVLVARYLFTYLRDGLVARANQEGRFEGYERAQLVRWRNSFLIGAAREIYQRLVDEKLARQQARDLEAVLVTPPSELSKAGSGPAGTALVEIKKPQVEAYVKQQHPKLRTGAASKASISAEAHAAGRRAGQEIPLRQGIESKQRGQLPQKG